MEISSVMRSFRRMCSSLTNVQFSHVARGTTFAIMFTSLFFGTFVLPVSASTIGARAPAPLSVHRSNDSTTTTSTTTSTTSTTTTTLPPATTTIGNIQFPSGAVDASEPSGEGPASSTALPGYSESYVNDFATKSSLVGWVSFQGPTNGDPGGQFAQSHVTVSGGLLQLNSWQDPAFGNAWATGGVCQCDINNTYGAYFVRSRVTGPGPTQVEMLMPEVGWPPEIDFNETRQSDGNTIATLHYTSADLQIYRSLNIDLTQWHTWGVVWTPTSLTYTVDGQAWGIIDSASEIPDQPMHLDITQQTWCSSGFACPTAPESTQVDWVEEYKPTIGESAALGTFAPNSWALTPVLKAKIVKLAVKIKVQGDNSVALVGYNDDSGTAAKGIAISRIRARVVGRILKQQLAVLGVTGVSITTTGKGDAQSVASNATPKGRARNRRVVPWIM